MLATVGVGVGESGVVGVGLKVVVSVGLGVSVAMSRVLSHFLPLVSAADRISIAGVSAALGALALVARYVPARRATKVPAITALRHE